LGATNSAEPLPVPPIPVRSNLGTTRHQKATRLYRHGTQHYLSHPENMNAIRNGRCFTDEAEGRSQTNAQAAPTCRHQGANTPEAPHRMSKCQDMSRLEGRPVSAKARVRTLPATHIRTRWRLTKPWPEPSGNNRKKLPTGQGSVVQRRRRTPFLTLPQHDCGRAAPG
jgi:hypothetical protein